MLETHVATAAPVGMTGAAVPSPRNDRGRPYGTTAVRLLACFLIAATAACSNGSATPTDRGAPGPTTAGPASVPTDATPSYDTPSSVPPATAVLTDPMKDLTAKHGSVVRTTALLSERGRTSATYTLEGSSKADAFVTVSCPGPGRYTVTGDGEVLIGSVCTGSAAADIRLPLSSIGTTISVQAPGPFWLVIAPATS